MVGEILREGWQKSLEEHRVWEREQALTKATEPNSSAPTETGLIAERSAIRDITVPAARQVVEYPLPFSENTMREFFLDSQGRMWWASPTNNKVGYFYLASN